MFRNILVALVVVRTTFRGSRVTPLHMSANVLGFEV